MMLRNPASTESAEGNNCIGRAHCVPRALAPGAGLSRLETEMHILHHEVCLEGKWWNSSKHAKTRGTWTVSQTFDVDTICAI